MFWVKNRKQYLEDTSRKISWGHWFVFFNILWVIIIGSRYAFIIDWPDTLFGKLYFFTSLAGHFSFIVFALYLLIVFPLSFVVKNHRTFRGLTVILATLGNTLLLVDTEVFARFNLHLSSLVWNLLVNPENGELSRNWQLFFVPMPFILLVQMLFSRWSWEKLRSLERQKWLKLVGLFFICCFTATHLIYAWADAYIYRPITMQKSNFPLSYPMTARSFLEKHGFLDHEQYNETLKQEGRLDALKTNYPKQTLTFDENLTPNNVILINVSGLQYQAVKPETMPQLSQFAENSTSFLYHYSTGNQTNHSLTGLFYGLNGGYTDSLLSNKTRSVLQQALAQSKVRYELGLFSVNDSNATLYHQIWFNQKPHKTNTTSTNPQKVEEFNQWYQKVSKTSQPHFGYLNLRIPANLDSFAYQQQLMQIDQLLGSVLGNLQRQNTLIIITAEQGYSFNQLSEKQQQHYFAPDIIHVPLIISWAGIATGKIEQLSSHADIVPTIMQHIFKVQNPTTDYSLGKDLFDLKKTRDWILAGNHRWTVIISEDGSQYHIDRNGNYQKYDRTYQSESSGQPPFGLFLDVFTQQLQFVKK